MINAIQKEAIRLQLNISYMQGKVDMLASILAVFDKAPSVDAKELEGALREVQEKQSRALDNATKSYEDLYGEYIDDDKE